MRVFVSIGWSPETIDYLQKWQRKLQEAGVKGYWRRGVNLHLTLKFLGEVEPGQIPSLMQALKQAGRGIKPFELELHGLGVFPNLREPRILWAGVSDSALSLLHESLENELEKCGFPRENRNFRPHITLASGGITGLGFSLPDFGRTLRIREKVTWFELMESMVENGVRKYKSLASFELS